MLPSAPGAMAIIKRGGSQTSLDKRQRHWEKGWVNPATEDEYDEEEEDKDESADFYTKLTDRETFLFLNNQTSNVSLDLSDNTNIDSPV